MLIVVRHLAFLIVGFVTGVFAAWAAVELVSPCSLDAITLFWVLTAVLSGSLIYHLLSVVFREAWWPATSMAAVILLLVQAYAFTTLTGTYSIHRVKQTESAMRRIAAVMEEVREEIGRYPKLSSVGELNGLTGSELPVIDAWGYEFSLTSTPDEFLLISLGECGEPDEGPAADPWSKDRAIRNGSFLAKPEYVQ